MLTKNEWIGIVARRRPWLLFIGCNDVLGDRLVLRGDEAHHLHKVRRQTVDDLIDVVDGEGNFTTYVVELRGVRALGDR